MNPETRQRALNGLGVILVGLSLSGCGRSDRPVEATPTIIPTETPERKIFESSAFSTEGYSEQIVDQIKLMWMYGTAPDRYQLLSLPNNTNAIIRIKPPLNEVKPEETASTSINTQVLELEPNHNFLVITAEGNLDPESYQQWDNDTVDKLQQVDINHEALIFLSQLYFMSSSLKELGFDMDKSFEKQQIPYPPTAEFVSQFEKIIADSFVVSESVAEIGDYFLLDKIVDRDPDGTPRFVRAQTTDMRGKSIISILPTINGLPYNDHEYFLRLNTTIGPTLKQFSTFEDLVQGYESFSDIPGFHEYSKAIEELLSR